MEAPFRSALSTPLLLRALALRLRSAITCHAGVNGTRRCCPAPPLTSRPCASSRRARPGEDARTDGTQKIRGGDPDRARFPHRRTPQSPLCASDASRSTRFEMTSILASSSDPFRCGANALPAAAAAGSSRSPPLRLKCAWSSTPCDFAQFGVDSGSICISCAPSL
ncbi:hypothetical protein F5148DRAFT_1215228 [Russula earlei]|uniref:Uncharacterized protein n=1 Tax=Russula earlei TaxID=71964 RepID=A0ACC0U497_9AGAM|nr:hypothetical protein F5148DRAFT_1215228 [Russula earlei]